MSNENRTVRKMMGTLIFAPWTAEFLCVADAHWQCVAADSWVCCQKSDSWSQAATRLCANCLSNSYAHVMILLWWNRTKLDKFLVDRVRHNRSRCCHLTRTWKNLRALGEPTSDGPQAGWGWQVPELNVKPWSTLSAWNNGFFGIKVRFIWIEREDHEIAVSIFN